MFEILFWITRTIFALIKRKMKNETEKKLDEGEQSQEDQDGDGGEMKSEKKSLEEDGAKGVEAKREEEGSV